MIIYYFWYSRNVKVGWERHTKIMTNDPNIKVGTNELHIQSLSGSYAGQYSCYGEDGSTRSQNKITTVIVQCKYWLTVN